MENKTKKEDKKHPLTENPKNKNQKIKQKKAATSKFLTKLKGEKKKKRTPKHHSLEIITKQRKKESTN